ncbi:MAG: DUF4338 domain-containing protein [Spirochaetales bacterium]|nr:DUF4338 domain-containing protein [Spirochaetales bacterium]
MISTFAIETFRYSGRDFTPAEMDWIRDLIASHPELHRLALSREVCREMSWLRPDGGLKDMSCRVAMLRMHRDEYIGWTRDSRVNNLHMIVNNARFLILPWIKSKNLASKILAGAAKQIQNDWFNRYGYRPVLLETFVESRRFRGTCYKAANWIHVGQTQGRGKLDRKHLNAVQIKDIFLYPLDKQFRAGLCE